MKQLLFFICILIFACNSEDANDCFKNTGSIIQQERQVAPFETILVNRNIELIITEGIEHSVTIESGTYLINDVEAIVVDSQLQLTHNAICNLVRDYGDTKVYVTAPNIAKIISSTQYDISSTNVLTYPDLVLSSEDFNGTSEFTVGDFRLQVNSNSLRVVSNNLSSFYIHGETNSLNVSFPSGDGRFEGENLIAKDVNVFHRGTNAIIVNPQQSLTGQLRSTGDLISVNTPPIVDVGVFYTGQLVFDLD